jgi:Tol biopolymer transport system component
MFRTDPKHSRHRPTRLLRLLPLCLALAGAGCSGTKPIAGSGDAGGRHIAVFASDRNQALGQYDLYIWDFDEMRFRALSVNVNTTAAERHPTISTGGQFIAYESDRGAGTLDDISMFDRYNLTLVSLPGLNSADRETEPVFTGDGLKLAYVQQVNGQRRIRLYDGQTKLLVPLPGLDTLGASYSDYSPAPNRDGSVLAFVSNRNGNPDVFLYSRPLQRIIDLPELRSAGNDVDPYFSTTGRYLAYATDRAGGLGGYDLALVEFDVRDTAEIDVRAANSAFTERRPSVSDGGGVIVFQSDRPTGLGRFDLWKYDRGSGQTTQDPGLGSLSDEIEPTLYWPF